MTNSRFSRTALGLPGRLTIRVFARIAEIPLPNIALLVIFILLICMAIAMPGTTIRLGYLAGISVRAAVG